MAKHTLFDLAYDVARALYHASHNLAVEFAEWVTLSDLPVSGTPHEALITLADDFVGFCAQPV